MGADLLIAAVYYHKDQELDFAAGFRLINEVGDVSDASGLIRTYVSATGSGPEGDKPTGDELDEMRGTAIVRLQDLRAAVFGLGSRDVTILQVGEWYAVLAGGTSWGDSPGPCFDAINDLGEWPELLHAVGFTTEWKEQDTVTIERSTLETLTKAAEVGCGSLLAFVESGCSSDVESDRTEIAKWQRAMHDANIS